MKFLLACCLSLILGLSSSAQKTNDSIQKQIKSLKAEKTIFLTYDGSSSKLMAIAPNFADAETKAAGIQAMNFAMAFFYAGQTLAAPPDVINFTFWPMSKKPRFAGSTGPWEVTLASGPLNLGDYRYAAKSSENMEYLNFKIKRDDLAKIAASTAPVKFRLGTQTFSFTSEQVQLLKNFLAISDSK